MFSNIIPTPNLKNASNVFPFRKKSWRSTKNPNVPTPPRVIWTVLKSISKEPYQESETLLIENLALIGNGHGWSGLIRLTSEDDNLKVFLSVEPTIRTNNITDGINI